MDESPISTCEAVQLVSFAGNVSSMALDEVFGFLAGNGLEGTLSVQSGDDIALRLYFHEGLIFFPFSSRRGTYNLGKILRHTGVLSRKGLVGYLDDLSAKTKELEGQDEDSEEVRVAKRMQFTEEIHDLFLWGDARFEFTPGQWPPRVQADRDAARGVTLETTSLLMEVAKRADERRRIRLSVPSSRYMLGTAEGSEEAIVSALNAIGIEVSSSPFDGTLSLDDLLERWGVPHHVALAAVAGLVEAGHVEPVDAEETRERIRTLLAGPDLLPAARLLGHWIELRTRQGGGGGSSLGLEQEFVTSNAFVSGPEESTSLRLEGSRVFTLIRVLTAMGNPFTLVLNHRGWEKRVAALPGEVFVKNERRSEAATPPLTDYLVKQGALTKAQVAQLAGEPADAVTPEQLVKANLAKLIDELAEIVFWGRTDVELRNRCAKGTGADDSVTLSLGPVEREGLQDGLDRWASIFDKVPGDDCVFVPGWGAKSSDGKDPAARFFQRFSLQQNVGELRRKAQASRLDFVQFVNRGLERGYLRSPTVEELRKELEAAQATGNDVMAYRLASAGVSLGKGSEFEELLAGLRAVETALPGSFPALEGDLDGVGLGALLQALQQHRRTGTLEVRAGRRDEKLFFARGEAFILRVDDAEADEFVAFFLGDEGADSVSELGTGLADRGLVNESELSEAEIKELKDSFLDVLLWEGSTFCFFQNQLPEEFYDPGDGVSKVALQTGRFLMEAMQLVTEYEAIVEVVGSSRTIYAFAQANGKLEAIQALGYPEILTLVDGRLCFEDLVRISGAQRLEVGRVVRGLVEAGSLEKKGEKPLPGSDLPDPVMD